MKVLFYYEFVPDSRTINAEVYSQQLENMYTVLLEKYPALMLLQQDNARPHTQRRKLFRKPTNWKILNCYRIPLLVLILSLQTTICFRSMAQFLHGKKFQSVADVEVTVEEFFASKDKESFYQAFKELAEKWVKTIEHEGLYFEY
jgi:hypothetical protein